MRSSSSELRPDNRQVVDLLRRQHAFAGARLRLDHFVLRGDRDRLGLRADFQPDVDAARVLRLHHDRLLLVGLKPDSSTFSEYEPPKMAEKEVATAFIGDCRQDCLGGIVRQRDGRARKHTTARVLYGASDGGSVGRLAERRPWS